MPSGRPLTLANPALAFLIRRRGREEQEPEGTNQQLLVRSGWVTNGLGPGRPGPINQTKPNRKEVTQPLVFPTVAANATTPGVLTTTRLNHSEVKLKVDATTAGTKLKVSAATVSPMRESQRVLIGFSKSMDLISNPRSLLSPRLPPLYGDELCCGVCLCNTTQ